MTVEQQPLTVLAKKEASYQAKLSAYGTVKGALSTFQSAVAGLSTTSKFQSLSASSSDSSMVAVSAKSPAQVGTYSLDITSLAHAQSLAAGGVASDTAAIGNGTLTFDFGTISNGTLGLDGKYTNASFDSNGNGTKTVTIDATNNSLQGIRDAINNAGIGVTASIINDGSATPYRLVLNSNSMGKANSLKISVAGDQALSDLLANDPANNAGQNLSETATAQDAVFKFNGIAMSKASNLITDALPGLTLNLLKAPTTSPVSVTVARDTSSINSSVSALVKAYNDLNAALKSVSSYDPATKTGQILQGDSMVRTLQAQVRAALGTSVSNTGGSITTLSQIGVSFQKDGTLALDSSKLSAAVSSNFSDIAALFTTVGSASDSLIDYSSATSATKPGSYAVNVSTVATQGKLTGASIAGLVIDGTNNTLNVVVNGISATVTLAQQTYASANALVAEVQSKINGASALSSAGVSVAVSQSGGVFSVVSNTYGSNSSVTATGNGVSNLLGSPTSTNGVDVAGTIDGMAATGSGQFLTGIGNASGLKIKINGGATGARGLVYYSQGYAYTLNQWATSLLASGGPLDGVTKGINASISDIGKQRDALNAHLADVQARYTRQFSALDTLLSSMNATNNYLTQQLANLPKPY